MAFKQTEYLCKTSENYYNFSWNLILVKYIDIILTLMLQFDCRYVSNIFYKKMFHGELTKGLIWHTNIPGCPPTIEAWKIIHFLGGFRICFTCFITRTLLRLRTLYSSRGSCRESVKATWAIETTATPIFLQSGFGWWHIFQTVSAV